MKTRKMPGIVEVFQNAGVGGPLCAIGIMKLQRFRASSVFWMCFDLGKSLTIPGIFCVLLDLRTRIPAKDSLAYRESFALAYRQKTRIPGSAGGSFGASAFGFWVARGVPGITERAFDK